MAGGLPALYAKAALRKVSELTSRESADEYDHRGAAEDELARLIRQDEWPPAVWPIRGAPKDQEARGDTDDGERIVIDARKPDERVQLEAIYGSRNKAKAPCHLETKRRVLEQCAVA